MSNIYGKIHGPDSKLFKLVKTKIFKNRIKKHILRQGKTYFRVSDNSLQTDYIQLVKS